MDGNMSLVNQSDHHDHTNNTVRINVHIAIWGTVLTISNISLNLGNIVAFCKSKLLREKPSNLLILTLCSVDLFQGLFVMPLVWYAFVFDQRWDFGESGCRFAQATMRLALGQGLCLVIAIVTKFHSWNYRNLHGLTFVNGLKLEVLLLLV